MTNHKEKITTVSRHRRILFSTVTILITLLICFGVCEGVFRILEIKAKASTYSEGSGGKAIVDKRWGWKPNPGWYHRVNPEFDVKGNINEHFMNDSPIDMERDVALTRLMILGDSHTFAVGVSSDDSWPHALVPILEKKYPSYHFRTYNTAMPNYSMHHYLLRLIDQGPIVKPNYVIIGLSYATDLYDLLPPEHGGWYGGGHDKERDYFYLTDNGDLEERHWNPGKNNEIRKGFGTTARKLRSFLANFATFRYLRRSLLALYIGSHLSIGGNSLWPNMEIVLEKQISQKHQYAWKIFKAIMTRIKTEATKLGAETIVVGIPYLPQVYDEVWENSFDNEQYSRDSANKIVARWCRENSIAYIDTLRFFRKTYTSTGKWLHHHYDAHPNVEGHMTIANAIAEYPFEAPRLENREN